MLALFRGLMVPVFFLVFLALFGAVALAVIALGPIGLDGLAPQALAGLIPTGGGTPSPWVIAAGAALAADLLIGMIAMLIAEHVHTVGRFTRALVKTSLWFAVLGGGGLAAYLNGLPGEGWQRFAPALLFAGGLAAAAIVSGLLLGKPFLWWVSERPPVRKQRVVQPQPEIEPALQTTADTAGAPATTQRPKEPAGPVAPSEADRADAYHS